MKLVHEFKEFIARGNVIDLAIGVIIGAAFGKIVTSLVGDIITPFIGLLTGRIAFSGLYFSLDGKTYETIDAARAVKAPIIAYGSFIDTLIQFLIVAACIFAMVKAINRLKREEAAKPDPAPPAPTPEVILLTEIRDALKNPPAK